MLDSVQLKLLFLFLSCLVATASGQDNTTAPMLYQPGVVSPALEYAFYIRVTLKGSARSEDTQIRQYLSQFKNTIKRIGEIDEEAGLEITIGLGYDLTERWFEQRRRPRDNSTMPISFHPYNRLRGSGGRFPVSDGDIFLHIKSRRHDLSFEAGKAFVDYFPSKSRTIRNIDETMGFSRMKQRCPAGFALDFTGFEDGVANPQAQDVRVAAAVINDSIDRRHAGGSFALTQTWIHKLDKFNALPVRTQETEIIGRTKGYDSQIVFPSSNSSHIWRNFVREGGVQLQIVRQSTSIANTAEQGLFFIAYSNSIRKFDTLLKRMIGMDGPHDRLMEFSTPITGNYWYIPSAVELEALGNCDNN